MYSIKNYLERDTLDIYPNQKIEVVLNLMDELQLQQMIVLNGSELIGIVFKEDIDDKPEEILTLDKIRIKGVGVKGDLHLYEGARIMATQSLEVLPVLDSEMNYIGALRIDNVFEMVVKMTAVDLKGGIILLRKRSVDYSMAEIARICESNDVRVISSGIMPEEDSNALIVTIRVDKYELSGLIAAFERYEYEVVASYGDNQYKDYLKDRYDLLMNYLNM